ncbi:LysE family transporter [Flavihumibacter sp. UBA7668]|uniref:LysE family transporter n=1 Tax=Flavihumibacter sp. UBA7668 TaxID=1946542 RepID=UPI0025BBE305|nr:LysE family transporter [Flavihumibacter sp. UBA7668]
MNLIISFFCSIAGSLTPGTINLSVLQSGLNGQAKMGRRMALAAGLMEYFYAGMAIYFEALINRQIGVFTWFKLLAAIILLVLGGAALLPGKTMKKKTAPKTGGFRKGLLLGLLNPLAMPFWISIIAYLKSMDWIRLNNWMEIHLFLLGVSLGVFSLLLGVTYAAEKIQRKGWVQSDLLIQLPSWLMLVLGIIGIVHFLIL